jgi:hypothetical protein
VSEGRDVRLHPERLLGRWERHLRIDDEREKHKRIKLN